MESPVHTDANARPLEKRRAGRVYGSRPICDTLLQDMSKARDTCLTLSVPISVNNSLYPDQSRPAPVIPASLSIVVCLCLVNVKGS